MAYGTVNVGQAQTDDSKYLTTEQVGTPSGLATLDANGKLTASQRPDVDAYTRKQTDDLVDQDVAAGRAIVTEPLRYTLPGGFEEGKNYKTYTSPAQCEEQLRQLLADPAAILAMAQHNAAYYQAWLRPEQQVRQALRQLETGEM